MFENLHTGLTYKEEMLVGDSDSAKAFGSGSVDVFATPAMIAFMESTAMYCVKRFLPAGFSTVGTHIDVSHKKATPLYMKVTCEAKLIKIEGRKLVFEVNAFDEEGEIGCGTHNRFIINEEKFMAKLNK